MRRFIDQFKHSSKAIQTRGPSLPSDLSYSEFEFLTKRGFLARKLSQYLGLDNEKSDSLFYLSMSNVSIDDHILLLSDQMLRWGKQGEDIPRKISELNLTPNIQNALLKIYDMFKQEVFTPFREQIQPCNQEGDSKWKIYRDVMFAATQEKFLLISEDEVSQYKKGEIFCEGTIKERSDIPLCRNRAKESLERQGVNKTKIMSWLLILSEAMTNTIKHAEEGKMTLIEAEKNNEVYFVIEDKGPGFSLEELPKTTLLAGYSTKKSMGQGFTLMMKMAKQVLLYTTPTGSTIILTFDASKEKKEMGMDATG